VQGNAIAKAEAEQLKQNIIDAQNALNGDLYLTHVLHSQLHYHNLLSNYHLH
jgi:hypothetical protein